MGGGGWPGTASRPPRKYNNNKSINIITNYVIRAEREGGAGLEQPLALLARHVRVDALRGEHKQEHYKQIRRGGGEGGVVSGRMLCKGGQRGKGKKVKEGQW